MGDLFRWLTLLGIVLATLFTWFVVPALYEIFIARHAKRIREWLATWRTGRLRRKYIRLFVEAVRGEAKLTNTRYLQQLIRLLPFSVIMFSVYCLLEVERGKATLIDNLATIAEQKESINRRKEGGAAIAVDVGVKEDDQDNDVRQLEAKVLDTEREARCLMSKVKYYRGILTLNLLLGVSLLIWFEFVFTPIVEFRARFSHELERFTVRIQGLASKTELAELTRQEARVCDEQSARAYVEAMAAIAKRHNIEELTESFLLWGPANVPDEIA